MRQINLFIYSYRKYFYLFVFVALLAISSNVRNDFDVYFLLANGREILTNGFPHTDWISMHHGLHIIVQQWLVSVIDYFVWEIGKEPGLVALVFILNTALYWTLFKTLVARSNDNYVVAGITTIIAAATINACYSNARPQLWSLLWICVTVYLFSKYIVDEKVKYLIDIAIVLVLQANFHSTFWFAIEIVLIVLFFENERKLEHKGRFWLFWCLSLVTCFINPYGVEGVLHPFYTLGHQEYNTINELLPLDAPAFILSAVPSIILLVVSFIKGRKHWLDNIPMTLLSLALLYISLKSSRFVIFFILVASFAVAHNQQEPIRCKHCKQKTITDMRNFFVFSFVCTFFVGLCAMSLAGSVANYNYIVTDIDDVSMHMNRGTVYSNEIQNGQYLYFKNRNNPYMDARLETYIENVNGKKEIFQEYLENLDDTPEEFRFFTDRYSFDYLVLTTKSKQKRDADALENYHVIYHNHTLYLYERNDNKSYQ